MTRLYSAARYNVTASRSSDGGAALGVEVPAVAGTALSETTNRSPAGNAQAEARQPRVEVEHILITLPFIRSTRRCRCIQLAHVFLDHPFRTETGGNGFNALFDNVKPSAWDAIEITLIEQWHDFLF